MNILLDTHALIWFLEGHLSLSISARAAIENTNNKKFVSIATFWELAIKSSMGKLDIQLSFSDLYKLVWQNNFEILPIDFDHTLIISTLHFHHKDPFDRILIAQAMVEKMVIVSKETNIFPCITLI